MNRQNQEQNQSTKALTKRQMNIKLNETGNIHTCSPRKMKFKLLSPWRKAFTNALMALGPIWPLEIWYFNMVIAILTWEKNPLYLKSLAFERICREFGCELHWVQWNLLPDKHASLSAYEMYIYNDTEFCCGEKDAIAIFSTCDLTFRRDFKKLFLSSFGRIYLFILQAQSYSPLTYLAWLITKSLKGDKTGFLPEMPRLVKWTCCHRTN